MRTFTCLVLIAHLLPIAHPTTAQEAAAQDRQGGGSSNAPQAPPALEREGLRTSGLMGAIADIPAEALCPASWAPLRYLPGAILGCTCAAEQITGSVWGSGPYTFDSALCAAARHAGAIGATGGPIWITVGPGLEAFSGSTANDITTLNYGPYEPAGIFLSTPGGDGQDAQQIDACPGNMSGQASQVTCHCAPSAIGTSGVWGTALYTHDSALCTAALHAGVVGPEGGTITAEPQTDAGSYLGSTRNGVTSLDYGAYNGAFRLLPN